MRGLAEGADMVELGSTALPARAAAPGGVWNGSLAGDLQEPLAHLEGAESVRGGS